MNSNRMRFSENELLLILLKHEEHTNTETDWDNYVGGLKKQVFPYSNEIKKIFQVSKWSDIQEQLKNAWKDHELVKDIDDTNSKKDFVIIAVNKLLIKKQTEAVKEHLTSTQSYNQFRKEHPEMNLPHFQNIIYTFGSWNSFKEVLGLETHKMGRRPTYTDEELINILKEHHEHFVDAKRWDTYAAEKNLPKFNLIRNRLPRNIIQRYSDYGKRYDYSLEQLIEIVNNHRSILMKGQRAWELYAKENKLPRYPTLTARLGNENIKNVMRGGSLSVEDF